MGGGHGVGQMSIRFFEGGGEHRARAPPTPRALALRARALAPSDSSSPSDSSRPRASRSGARAPEGGGPLRLLSFALALCKVRSKRRIGRSVGPLPACLFLKEGRRA